MIIKSSFHEHLTSNPIIRLWSKALSSKFRILLYLLVLCAVSLVSLKKGKDFSKSGRYGAFQSRFSHFLQSGRHVPANWFLSHFEQAETINISIKHMNMQKLAYEVDRAHKNGAISPEMKAVAVPCVIHFKNETYKAKAHIKGQELKHLQPDKWSLKFSLSDSKTILGLNKFSVQAPATRNFANEPLYHRFMVQNNLIGLQCDFVNVILNGKKLGIFNLEESFHKILLERNHHREGLIFKIQGNTIKYYNQKKLLRKKPSYLNHVAIITRQLKNFKQGKLETRDIFETNKLAKYMAISDLFGAIHGHLENNFPIYFNPITHLWEPIPIDGNSGLRLPNVIAGSFSGHPWVGGVRDLGFRLFSDTLFYRLYVNTLEDLDTKWINENFGHAAESYFRHVRLIHKSYPEYHADTSFLYHNLSVIQKVLSPESKIANAAYNSFPTQNKLRISFDIESNVPLEIHNLYQGEQKMASPSPWQRIYYPPRNQQAGQAECTIKLPIPTNDSNFNRTDYFLEYGVLGSRQKAKVRLMPFPDTTFALPNDYLKPSFPMQKRYLGIIVDSLHSNIIFPEGNILIDTPLILPKNHRVVFMAGANINLVNHAKIVSYSPIEINGTKQNKVRFFSSDSSGQGLTVLGAGKNSTIKYLDYKNQGAPKIEGWVLSGSLNFYESPITIEYSNLSKNRSEDLLNIIRSKFHITHSVFGNAHSDAFDGDFVEGSIRYCRFLNSANDAIDVSGSEIHINAVQIIGTGDKGISAGESSVIHAQNIEINSAEIAVASKDGSTIFIDSLKVDSSSVALTCFKKKSEYSTANMVATHTNIRAAKIRTLLENGSQMRINGRMVPYFNGNVKEILYGAVFGKKTVR